MHHSSGEGPTDACGAVPGRDDSDISRLSSVAESKRSPSPSLLQVYFIEMPDMATAPVTDVFFLIYVFKNSVPCVANSLRSFAMQTLLQLTVLLWMVVLPTLQAPIISPAVMGKQLRCGGDARYSSFSDADCYVDLHPCRRVSDEVTLPPTVV